VRTAEAPAILEENNGGDIGRTVKNERENKKFARRQVKAFMDIPAAILGSRQMVSKHRDMGIVMSCPNLLEGPQAFFALQSSYKEGSAVAAAPCRSI